MQYVIPNTKYQIEVNPVSDECGKGVMVIVRDLSIELPPFNPMTHLDDISANVIHSELVKIND